MSVSTPSKPKKRPAENNGPDTPSKYRKTELNTDQEKFTNSRMFDKPGVGRILDRRVSLNMLNDSSLYSILRAWVYDNPEIEQPQVCSLTCVWLTEVYVCRLHNLHREQARIMTFQLIMTMLYDT